MPTSRPSRREFARLSTAGIVALGSRAQAATGQRPPDFSLRSVVGTAWKGSFRLSDHLGKRPIVLAFFATWCRPCEIELPLLQAQRARFEESKLTLAAIAIDGPETAAQIPSLARRLRLAFPILHDADSTVSSRLNPQRSVPFLIAIDRRGKIIHERSGFSPEQQRTLPSEIEALVQTG